MAKVATQPAPGSLTSSSLHIGGNARKVAAAMVKRKTPSELRGEQLKRTNIMESIDESPAPLCGLMNSPSDNGFKKSDLPRNPRFIGTRMDEVYPAKKSRLRVLSTKENAKENALTAQTNSMKNISVLSDLAMKRRISSQETSAASSASAIVSEVCKLEAHPTVERCSQSIFRSVTELSHCEKSSGFTVVDMDKALKGLAAHEIPAISGLTSNTSGDYGNDTSLRSGSFFSECCVTGPKAPLDLTLKKKMWVSSSCSVNWIHRSIMSSAYIGVLHSKSQLGYPEGGSGSEQALTSQIINTKSLHSWVYPQSTLPSSVISVLSSQPDGDFLRKRQMGWNDSFRSLYYMLRKNICSIFYVCTSHFVVMFIHSSGSRVSKQACDAYISQSTRGLRSLLKEHDVSFSMPLCHSKVEQVTTEDLVELSEIEKQNLGQTQRPASFSDVDNSPESLLAFCGNKNVHALYDFLLNYRSSLTFLSGVDVPVLYSPVPFQNAALSAPEIRCVEMKRVDGTSASPRDSKMKDGESLECSSSNLRSSIQISDAYIPSWIIYRVCALIGSEGKSFEASFVTEHTSIGLNVALKTVFENSNSKDASSKDLQEECSYSFGFPKATISSYLDSGFLKNLKYSNGSYTAFLSPK